MTTDDILEKYVRPYYFLWDQTYDQSHLQHALICVFGFGTVGMVFCQVFHPGDWALMWTSGLAAGILGGLLGYLERELRTRIGYYFKGRRLGIPKIAYDWWDGFLDVFFPLIYNGTFVAVIIFIGPIPWQLGVLYYLAAWSLLFLYGFFRPKNTLHYNRLFNATAP